MLVRKKILLLLPLIVLSVLILFIAVIPAQVDAQGQPVVPGTGSISEECGYVDPGCQLPKALNWLSSTLLSMFAGFLLLAGNVFDKFLDLMVVNFFQTFGGAFFEALKEAWKIVRDFSNIAIIGVFVFVAIMTILGRADYGAKALVAKVLVVAVLINFSFLFTELIIRTSNFTAEQLSKTFPVQMKVSGTGEAMLQSFGIEGYWDGTRKLVDQTSAKANNSGAGFLYALVGGTVILALGLVLLYGAFLITARALLLLFSLLSSSFAFASFMWPSAADLPYIGWSAWWSNLIKAAVFGPILILFLRIYSLMLQRVQNNISGAGEALSGVAANSNNPTIAWEQLILLIVLTVMLFVAFKAAGSFSNSIGGYGQLKFGLGAAIAYSARIGGAAGRFGIGRPMAKQDIKNAERLEAAQARLAHLNALNTKGIKGSWDRMWARGDVARFERAKKTSGELSRGQFNALNTGLDKLVKGLGAGAAIGGKSESAMARAERIAKEAAKKGGEAGMSKEGEKKAIEMQERFYKETREDAQKQLEVAQKTLQSVRGTQEHQKQQAIEKQGTDAMSKLGVQIQEAIQKGDKAAESKLKSELQEWGSKIENARTKITELEKGTSADIRRHLETLAKTSPEAIKDAITTANASEKREAAAKYAAGMFGNPDGYIAQMARDKFKKAGKEDDEWKNLPKAFRKFVEDSKNQQGGHH